ncbi:MAG: hypothetical protein GY702_11460 [Desulfobulbaceae bacterium]|nr:hypothetical protein [Desulfobulbaceae bacterium]
MKIKILYLSLSILQVSLFTERNRSPAPHFRPIRPPGIANYSQKTSLNEPGALDERLRTLVMRSF